MDVNEVLANIKARQEKVSAITDIERNLIVDVGLLSAWDPASINLPKAGSKREEYFKQLARDDVQVVLNKLYSIEGPVLQLPEPTTIIPRGKPVPKPKEPTKWERFAQQKGIKSNKNRDKLVYDEVTRTWVPRFGYKKVKNDREKNWVTEEKGDR